MENRSKTIFKRFDKNNGMKNYKWLAALFLCTTIVFAFLIATNINTDEVKRLKQEKKELITEIDSLKKLILLNDVLIQKEKDYRVSIENNIAMRDGSLVELKNIKNAEFQIILTDSAHIDFIKLDSLLTGLVKEYDL
jgi:hypothetical protein